MARKRTGPGSDQGRMSLVEHLSEFRTRLIISILAFGAAAAAGWVMAPDLLEILMVPARQAGAQMIQLSATEVFWVYVKLAVLGGLVLSSPVLLYEVLAFVWPGLEQSERRAVAILLPFAVLFFLAGVLFAYFLFLKYLFRFFLGFTAPGVATTLSVGSYITMILNLILPFGLVFELPVLLSLVARLGIVTPEFLARNRKYAVLIIFIVAAVLTPPDPVSQIVMAVPLLLLYEIGVLVVRLTVRRVTAARQASPTRG